jgi:transposase
MGLIVRPLSMRKIQEVLRQHQLGHSNRDIGRSLNISAGTVSNYLYRARVAGLDLSSALELSEAQLHERLFLPSKSSCSKRVFPDWEQVHAELRKKGMTLMLLWREYREKHPDGVGYSRFCLHYQRYAKQISPVMRQVHKAGEKTFVDYAGMTVPWLEPATGEIHEACIFVGSLGASQFTFIEATASQSLPDWIGSHIRMWEYFGGVSRVVVPDNLKSGVSKAHRYDPDINANYQHVGAHYGFAIVPARAGEPKDKAKVENAVGCIERQILAPLRHITFTSIAEINAAIKPRLDAFNQQHFQKMKTSRYELFDRLDKPALNPLPPEPYHYAQWKHARVNIDYHFVLDEHYYSVPYQYIHHAVEIRATPKTVECFYQGKRIAAHQRSKARYQHTTLAEHMPKNHQAQAQWTPERIKRWALKIGQNTSLLIEVMIAARPFPEQAFRACLGLLRLGSRFGEVRLEKACTIALHAGMTRYQQVERILKNKMDELNTISSQETPVIPHHNIRGSDYYQ